MFAVCKYLSIGTKPRERQMTINCTWKTKKDAADDARGMSSTFRDELYVVWPNPIHGATFHVAEANHFGDDADLRNYPNDARFFRAGAEVPRQFVRYYA